MNDLNPIHSVFAERLFHIPDYQRGYAWSEKQLKDFVEDIELLEPGKAHYFGTLVIQQMPAQQTPIIDRAGRFFTRVDVIDGQQRLTTVALLMDAIRDAMASRPELRELAEGIREVYLNVNDRAGQPMLRLNLNRDCDEFYRTSILGLGTDVAGPQIRSHRLLWDAANYFRDYLASQEAGLGDNYLAWLEDTFVKVAQHFTLLVYSVDRDADAGVIFETMNNRGKPITEMEKVKNYLLYLTSKLAVDTHIDLARQINATWQHLYESLMAAGLEKVEDEDRLLRAHWLTVYDYREREWKGSDSVKERFALGKYKDRHEKLLEELTAYVETLRNAATAFCEVLAPEVNGAYGNLGDRPDLRHDVIDIGIRFQRLGVSANLFPVLIGARLRYPDDGEGYLRLLTLCERFAFRVHRMPRSRSTSGSSWLIAIGYNIFHKATIAEACTEIQRALHHYSSNQAFELDLRNPEMDWYSWGALRYFLYERESALMLENGVPVIVPWDHFVDPAFRENTIEHILPRNPEPGGYWTQRFGPEEHARYVQDLGNLTLSFDNRKLGRLPFVSENGGVNKRKIYADSQLRAERELAHRTDWDQQAIAERREALVLWALKRWEVAKPPDAPTDYNASVESLLQRADGNGCGDEFRFLLDVAQRHNLGARPNKRTLTLVRQRDLRTRVISICTWPSGIQLELSHSQLSNDSVRVSEEQARDFLGAEYQWLTPRQLQEFAEKLDSLLGLSSGETNTDS